MRNEILADMDKMKRLAGESGCCESGGADSHDEKDIKAFFEDEEFAEKTIGLAEQMVKKGNIKLEKMQSSVIG